MTVIATDGRTMAGDGLTVAGWTVICTDTQKLTRIKDGRIVGTSGNAEDNQPFRNWLENGGDKPKLSDDFSGLVLSPDGSITHYSNTCIAWSASAPAAIGSGQDFALTAMDLGRSPVDAVKAACKRSMGCGGNITSMSIDGDVS